MMYSLLLNISYNKNINERNTMYHDYNTVFSLIYLFTNKNTYII
jgi:hypothetical protein